MNVLSGSDLEDLARAVEANPEARILMLTGLPRAFSAGVDVGEHAPEKEAIERMLAAMRRALSALLETSAVTIARVSGACLGGGAEIAAACDVIFTAEDARIGFPEIRLACFPPGACVLLPGRVGAARAAAWILSGDAVSGREALEAGFASECYPAGELSRETDRFAAALLSRGPAAVKAATRLLREPRRAALANGLPAAEDAYRSLAGDPDLAREVRKFEARRRS